MNNNKGIVYDKIKENNGIITTKEVLKLGISKGTLKKLTVNEEIEKIANGLYGFPNESIDEYLYFSYRIPKGIFSHETAAYLHGLTTKMPHIYTMTVISGDNVSRVKETKDNIVFKYVRNNYYNIGKTLIKSPFGRNIAVYDKERTILDIIRNKEKIDTQVFVEALKSYFLSKDKNLLNLSKYAKKMKMEKVLKQYTEVMLWKRQNK